MPTLELFSTSECQKCNKLAEYLSANNITFVKRVIDQDPNAETDAVRLHILSAPALRRGKDVLRTKDMFDSDGIAERNVKAFVEGGA